MVHRDEALLREITNKRALPFESLGYIFLEMSRKQKRLLLALLIELHGNNFIDMTTNYKVRIKLKMLLP